MFSAARKRSPSQTAADWSGYSGLLIVLFQADSEPLLLFQWSKHRVWTFSGKETRPKLSAESIGQASDLCVTQLENEAVIP